jgi:hypothetical protein
LQRKKPRLAASSGFNIDPIRMLASEGTFLIAITTPILNPAASQARWGRAFTRQKWDGFESTNAQ